MEEPNTPNDPTTPPDTAGTPAPNPPGDDAGGNTSGAAVPETGDGEGADASAGAGTDAEEAGGDGDGVLANLQTKPIDPSSIQARETPDAFSQTIPLDVATLEDVADHLAEDFAPEVRRFINTHPGVRSMVTIAVHAQGSLVHAHDVAADMTLARDTATTNTRLEQYLRTRFPQEFAGGAKPVDVIINLLDKAFPRTAAESGLAAANAGR